MGVRFSIRVSVCVIIGAWAVFSGVPVLADGVRDGRIGEAYGSTRAMDAGNDVSGDGECANTAGRGNLMDFFAMSIPGGGAGTNDPWYFAWTVDSSQALDDTAGFFFGNPATVKANYLIGIEVACDGAPRLEMWQNGQPWEREFAWNVDYFIAMFPTGPNSMEAQLWKNDGGNSRSLVAGGIAVTSQVVGFRRQIEFMLPASDPVPEALRDNSTLCLYLLSAQDIDGSGTVLDGIGLLNHNVSCEGAAFDLAGLGSVFINTEANAKPTGRPTDPGANERQSLSYPARSAVSSINGEDCTPPFGIGIDGVVDPSYVLLTEAGFAAPYEGGAVSASDFIGESAARTYSYLASGSTTTVTLAAGRHADLANIYSYGDTNHLYLLVTGPTSLGWDNEPDRFNLYIAIDMPGQESGHDAGGPNDLGPGDATAPAGRRVNFKGWDPDYAIELVWRGATPGSDTPANLYAATGPGTWSIAGVFPYQDVGNTASAGPGLYYSRTFPQYEFAVPWTELGLSGPPGPSDIIRLGVYTTGDENIETAGVSAWDIADQAPGIGQGCGGEGCHERVGDDALDDDSLSSSGDGDRTPYVGRSYDNPVFEPATDNGGNDVDTIEEYFAFRITLPSCVPGVAIEKATNGEDADTPSGPLLGVGSVVTWTYAVTNTGNVALTNVVVTDDRIGIIAGPASGDVNGNGLLDVGEIWFYSTNGLAAVGSYVNTGTVTAISLLGQPVSDNDPSHYFGADPGIAIEKATNGEDADTPSGPLLGVGSVVTWTYVVTNTGNVALTNVVVTDDRIGIIAGPASGDVNGNGLLDIGETWLYSTNGLAAVGPYVNTGSVTAVSQIGQPVSDEDPSHYFGAAGGIDIEKSTNGEDADSPPGPILAAGSPVTWTYQVRNLGNDAITNVAVTDTVIGPVTNLVSGDTNNNRLLDTNEVWIFTASGTAVSGAYSNDSTVGGTTVIGGTPVSDNDPSHYWGSAPGFTLVKTRLAPVPGPAYPGDPVTFRIDITNTGNVTLVTVPVEDRYETNSLAFAGATPDTDDTADDGLLNWADVGPLAPGAVTSIVVNFTARAPTGGDATNRVIARPVLPVDHPPVPPLTNQAPYAVDAYAALGDFVWRDTDADGIQDGGETGIAGVVVTLLDAVSNVVGVTTTDVAGAYAFTNLAAGAYRVVFYPPAGALHSPRDQGADDTADSDPDAASGITDPVTLLPGEVNTSIDAGFYFQAGVGDFVWRDVNQDGIQNPGEPGVELVQVTLYTTNNLVVGITTTDVNGAYAFTNLVPGAYYIRFGITIGQTFTLDLQDGDPALDSDASPINGRTPDFLLVAGEFNDTIDAGIREVLVYASIMAINGHNRRGVPVLEWETAVEYGTAGWIIERSDDGLEWEDASGYLPSSGNLQRGAVYAWSDSAARPGHACRYRLSEVEASGAVRVAAVTDVAYPADASDDPPPAGGFSIGVKSAPPRVPASVKSLPRTPESGGTGPVIGVKVGVREPGLYHVSVSELASAFSVPLSVVSGMTLRVEHLGLPIPSRREAGGVTFFGDAIASRYTRTNIYRIVQGDVAEAPEEPAGALSGIYSAAFSKPLVIERQVIMRPDLFNSADADPWLWAQLISGINPQFVTTTDLPKLVPGTGGSLAVRIKGSSFPTSGGGYHGIRVEVNNQVLGTFYVLGKNEHEEVLPVPPGVWMETGNVIRVVSAPPPGVSFDSFLLDGFTTEYLHAYEAVDDGLDFTAVPGSLIVTGFTTNRIEVWDVADPRQPVRLTGYAVEPSGAGWAARLEIPRAGRYFAAGHARAAPLVEPWRDAGLKQTQHAVDYLAVYGKGLQSGAEALAADRAAKGLSVMAVSIDAVYDAFNHGIVDGRALRTFFGYALRQWTRGPRYVALVGDGTLDYLDHYGAGNSLVPTEPEAGSYGMFASDYRAADIDYDGFVDLALGRIPVTTPAELGAYLAKLQHFESGGAWRDRILIATDNADAGGNYRLNGDELSGIITSKTVSRIDMDLVSEAAAKSNLLSGFAMGHEMLLYIGHGTMYQMAQEPLLNTTDAGALGNVSNAPVVGSLSCLIGSFGWPDHASLGKVLVTGAGGAVAHFGSASLITLAECQIISDEMLYSLYRDGTDRLGDAWLDSRNRMMESNYIRMVRSYQLLGDPAIALGDVNAAPPGAAAPQLAGYDEWLKWAVAPSLSDALPPLDPDDDADGDELTNDEERRVGSDPLDDGSGLVVVTVRPLSGGKVSVSWPSFAGRLYRVERAASPRHGYATVADDIPASAPVNTWTDEGPVPPFSVYRVYVK